MHPLKTGKCNPASWDFPCLTHTRVFPLPQRECGEPIFFAKHFPLFAWFSKFSPELNAQNKHFTHTHGRCRIPAARARRLYAATWRRRFFVWVCASILRAADIFFFTFFRTSDGENFNHKISPSLHGIRAWKCANASWKVFRTRWFAGETEFLAHLLDYFPAEVREHVCSCSKQQENWCGRRWGVQTSTFGVTPVKRRWNTNFVPYCTVPAIRKSLWFKFLRI